MLRFETISSEQMDICVTDRHCLVIDVRDYKDYNRMHIENAICIPFEKLEKEYNKMPRDLILVLYCERGGRSLLAAKELYDRGYVVKALMGGIRGYYGNRLERE